MAEQYQIAAGKEPGPFYSNEKKNRKVNGLLVKRIDANTGQVISTIDKPINDAMLTGDDYEAVIHYL